MEPNDNLKKLFTQIITKKGKKECSEKFLKIMLFNVKKKTLQDPNTFLLKNINKLSIPIKISNISKNQLTLKLVKKQSLLRTGLRDFIRTNKPNTWVNALITINNNQIPDSLNHKKRIYKRAETFKLDQI